MQSQAIRQQTTISPQQSLQVIKTLLTASFGCIAYLRNLLPDENFGESRLTAGERGILQCGISSQDSIGSSRHVSGVTIKTVTRGFSTEADKLLNYLEHGIFHAIERQYLKSFILAIYLDNEDPNNIVEAYTFNLTYHTAPGTSTTIPIMSLDDQLNKMTLGGRSNQALDPVAAASLQGKAPTLGDVKQSVRSLIKNLILITQALEPLPKRRFATFKLFYREETPHDYEPPYFRPGDPENDKFVFTTHDKSEAPEKFSVGTVTTPYHGVDVKIESVVKYIPNGEEDGSEFVALDSIAKGVNSYQTGSRSNQIDVQRKDAEKRVVAWSAERSLTDRDAEGEDDPEYANDSGIGFDEPLGKRDVGGNIKPMENSAMEMDEPEIRYFGRPEIVPSRVGELRRSTRIAAGESSLEPTQALESTLALDDSQDKMEQTQLDLIDGSASSRGVDTQLLKTVLDQSEMDWIADTPSSITGVIPQASSLKPPSQESSLTSVGTTVEPVDSDVMACACQLDDEKIDSVQCEACHKWSHIWCMGYHAADDERLPKAFMCIPCRLLGDINFPLISDAYPDILSALNDLALFRRSIKIAESQNPGSLKAFRNLARCEDDLAEQLWKRLEREGFIVLEITESDNLGMVETKTRVPRSNAKKKVKSSKQVQKYVFNDICVHSALYKDYFSPDSDAEKTMLGLKKMGRKGKSRKPRSEKVKPGLDEAQSTEVHMETRGVDGGDPVSRRGEDQVESQTQAETQAPTTPQRAAAELKRRVGGRSSGSGNGTSTEGRARVSKKMKISVGDGVDIEE